MAKPRADQHQGRVPIGECPHHTAAPTDLTVQPLEHGEWDWSLISADWDLDELSSWGMDLPKEWDNIEKKHQDISDDLIEKFCIEVSCVNEQEQESLFNELTQKGYECRILTL